MEEVPKPKLVNDQNHAVDSIAGGISFFFVKDRDLQTIAMFRSTWSLSVADCHIVLDVKGTTWVVQIENDGNVVRRISNDVLFG